MLVSSPDGEAAWAPGLQGDPYGRTAAWLVYASVGWVLFACAVVAATVGRGWSWPLFAWGIAVGVLAVACYYVFLRSGVALVARRLRQVQLAARRARLRARGRIVYPTLAGYSLGLAIVAAGLRSAWPDILLTVFIAVFQVLMPLVVLVALRR